MTLHPPPPHRPPTVSIYGPRLASYISIRSFSLPRVFAPHCYLGLTCQNPTAAAGSSLPFCSWLCVLTYIFVCFTPYWSRRAMLHQTEDILHCDVHGTSDDSVSVPSSLGYILQPHAFCCLPFIVFLSAIMRHKHQVLEIAANLLWIFQASSVIRLNRLLNRYFGHTVIPAELSSYLLVSFSPVPPSTNSGGPPDQFYRM